MYGIEESILLHHFYYWIAKNAANNKHFHEGLYWTYNSKKAFADFFAYMNETKIFRVIKNLEEKGIIVKGNFNTDKWDKTNWYALTVKGLKMMRDCGYDIAPFSISLQNDIIDCVKMNDGACQNERCNTDIITDNNNNKEEDIIISSKKEEKNAESDFIERIYKMYPTRCPKRNTSLGKGSKDKERIRRLLKTYSQEDIERVVRHEIEEKYGKAYMQNFSTFLNNFPDPSEMFSRENVAADNSQKEEIVLKRIYETLSAEEEARIYGLVPSAFSTLTTEQKNWWRKEKKQIMLEWIRSHAER